MAERTIAGRYRLTEPLGLGGSSSVWAAEDLVLERPVAVKVLGRDADRERFEREARAAAGLSHPNLNQLYDYGEAEEGPYIVLELLPGGSLEDRLPAGRPLDDAETSGIALGVAEGLAYAHAYGLVHRDLKPANVLFDAEGRPKIADFGIARLTGAGTLTEAGTVLGTAAYISPEQARGETATPASDVYSFGVMLYRMLTGRLPFEASEPMALAAMHATEEPPPIAELRPDAPGTLESLATAALAKDPADRPADGRALLAELAGAAPTVPIAAERAEVVPAPRRRTWAALGAVPLLVAAGVAVAFVVGGDPADPRPLAPASVREPTQATEEAPAPAPEPATTEETTTAETATATTEPATTEPAGTEDVPTESVPTESVPTESVPTESEP